MFEQLMEELKAAKHFIFMEYFIVEKGYMWGSILQILREKVKEGVEVRFMYDGMCAISMLPYRYPARLREVRDQMQDVQQGTPFSFYNPE